MSYRVTVTRAFQARQGLPSPIRQSKQLSPLQPKSGYKVALGISLAFADDKLGERGWFVDTDSLDDAIDNISTYLSSNQWTALFPFRPTFELVAHWIYQQLHAQIPGLDKVSLDNKTLGVCTVYSNHKIVTGS